MCVKLFKNKSGGAFIWRPLGGDICVADKRATLEYD